MKKSIHIYLIVQFVIYLQFIVFFLRPFNIDIESNTSKNFSTIINVISYGISIFVCTAYWSTTAIIFRRIKLLLLLLLVSAFSLVWSDMPNNTLVKTLSLLLQLIQSISIVILCIKYKINFLKIIQQSILVIVLLNTLFYLLFPTLSLSKALGEQGRYDALLPSPNSLAQIALLAITLWIPSNVKSISLRTVCVLLMSTLCLYISGSATGMASAIFIITIVLSLHVKQKYALIAFITIMYLCIIAWLVNPFGSGAQSFKLVNRDNTLTGRTIIWSYLVQEQKKDHREVLGYGVGGFWDSTRKKIHVDSFLDGFMQAHNGYLEMYLQLGIIGILFTIVILFKTLYLVLKNIKNPEYMNLCLSLVVILINNLTESSFISPKHPNWIFFTATYCIISISYRRSKVAMPKISKFTNNFFPPAKGNEVLVS